MLSLSLETMTLVPDTSSQLLPSRLGTFGPILICPRQDQWAGPYFWTSVSLAHSGLLERMLNIHSSKCQKNGVLREQTVCPRQSSALQSRGGIRIYYEQNTDPSLFGLISISHRGVCTYPILSSLCYTYSGSPIAINRIAQQGQIIAICRRVNLLFVGNYHSLQSSAADGGDSDNTLRKFNLSVFCTCCLEEYFRAN